MLSYMSLSLIWRDYGGSGIEISLYQVDAFILSMKNGIGQDSQGM